MEEMWPNQWWGIALLVAAVPAAIWLGRRRIKYRRLLRSSLEAIQLLDPEQWRVLWLLILKSVYWQLHRQMGQYLPGIDDGRGVIVYPQLMSQIGALDPESTVTVYDVSNVLGTLSELSYIRFGAGRNGAADERMLFLTADGSREVEKSLNKLSNGPLDEILHQPADHVGDTSSAARETWDVFISHASEDKTAVAQPLYSNLTAAGLSVWLDSAELKIGDSLRRKIDYGLANSRFGVVVLSSEFLRKGWTQWELDALVTRQNAGRQNILPIWHNITAAQVSEASPSLADKIARSTALSSIDEIASEIIAVVRGR